MSRIRRVLTIFTSLGPPMNYTLQATVPPYMLAKCAAALPRPSWEMGLYYAFLCIIIVLTVCVFIAAYFEAKRICVADSLKRKLKVLNSTQPFEKGKAFDLKNITGLSSIPSKTSLSPSSSSTSSSSSSSLYSSSSSPLPASSLPSPSSDSRCSTRSVAERSDHHADHSHHRTNKRWTFKTVIYLFKKLSSVFYISSSTAAATTAAISTANATPTSSNPTNTTTAAMANSNATSSATATTTNKKSNILNKANVPEKDSRDLHVQNNFKASSYEEKNSSSSGHHHNHSQHHHYQDDVTERSSSGNNNNSLTNTNTTVHRNKKTRAAKRYHNDLNSNSTDTNDRRLLSEKNTDSAQQKKVNYDKNFTSLSISSGSQDDYKSSHSNCSNSRRVSSEDQRNNDDQHSTNKTEGKSKKHIAMKMYLGIQKIYLQWFGSRSLSLSLFVVGPKGE